MNVEWLYPAALVSLAAAAGPVVVHLLRRQRATRVPFPTLQFLSPSPPSAARLRTPSDPILLALRAAIVIAAALAAAQPFVMTSWRQAAWESRTARALVVDSSESMTAAGVRVEEAVAAERQASPDALEIRTADLADGLKEASVALRNAGAGRLEIVVISDFQKGSLESARVATLPPETGIRFVPIDVTLPGGSFAGGREFRVGAPTREQRISLDGPRTRVTLVPARSPARAPSMLARPEDVAGVASMQRAVSAAGAPDLPADRGLVMIFPGVPMPAVEAPRARWMIDAVVAVRRDEQLAAVASAHEVGTDRRLPEAWVPVAQSAAGHPLVAIAAHEQDVAAFVSAAPGDLIAAAALRALLFAIAEPAPSGEREVERIDAAQLAAWTREPRPLPADRWTQRAPGDARWFWVFALLLLAVETVVRRTRPDAREEQRRAA